MDTGVLARLSGIQQRQRRAYERDFPRRRRDIRAGDGLAQRPSRRERARADHVCRIERRCRRLTRFDDHEIQFVRLTVAAVRLGTIAFCLLGPYSYLGGAFALDFGGKQAGAASSGIIDGIGYLGAVAAGYIVARISVSFGWQGVFVALAAVSTLAAIGAGCLYLLNAKAAASGRPLP